MEPTLDVKSSVERPTITIDWVRFPHDPSAYLGRATKKASAFAVYGGRGEGKSSLLENLSNNYATIIDIFGSRDNESLAWCRSPRKDSVLFLKGQSVEISSQWPSVNAVDVTLKQMSEYKAVVTCSAFYNDLHEEWFNLAQIMNTCWKRTHWDIPWCLAIREASNLLYSRTSLGDNQANAKNYIVYVLREMRHSGFAITLDSLRWFSIDIDIRTLADYTFLKAQGIEGLPDNLHWLYQYFDPYGVMRMGVEKFVVITRKGSVGCGTSTMPPWHKQETEDMLKLLNIEVKHGEAVNLGEKASSVGDFEHVKIINARNEKGPKDKPLSMGLLAKKLNRSSRTIMLHLDHHNDAVLRDGECEKCRRAKSPLSKETIS